MRTLELKRTSEVTWKTLATRSLAPRQAQSAGNRLEKQNLGRHPKENLSTNMTSQEIGRHSKV